MSTGRFDAGCTRLLSSTRMDPQVLRACGLFANLGSDQLRKIAAIARHRDLAAGEVIFREGDPGAEMFVVVAGRVRISKNVDGVGEEALTILDAGGYFGEMAIVEDAPRSADAIAHTTCALAVIGREDLDHVMFVDKDLAYDLLWTLVRTLSSRLRATNEKIKAFFAISGGGP